MKSPCLRKEGHQDLRNEEGRVCRSTWSTRSLVSGPSLQVVGCFRWRNPDSLSGQTGRARASRARRGTEGEVSSAPKKKKKGRRNTKRQHTREKKKWMKRASDQKTKGAARIVQPEKEREKKTKRNWRRETAKEDA